MAKKQKKEVTIRSSTAEYLTYIAATGDHKLRGIGYLDHPDEAMFGHAVPFYLYIPEKYISLKVIKL